MKTQLLCTFTRQTDLEDVVNIIIECNDILYDKIYVFSNQNDPASGFTFDAMAYDMANTAKLANSMETSEEELKYMRDYAERQAINRFTTAEIKIEMNNDMKINSETDLDGMVAYLEEKLAETLEETGTMGVHY